MLTHWKPFSVSGCPMRESAVETYLKREVAARSGETRAVSWRGRRGAPDRLVLLPPNLDQPRFFLAELKRPKGGELAPHQFREIQTLRLFEFPVEICWSKEQVDEVLERWYGRL